MAMSEAERSRSYRARKRERAGVVTIAAVPDPDGEPGPLLSAVDEHLKSVPGCNPVLAELARHLAAHIDGSTAANYQLAEALRRTTNDLHGNRGRIAPVKAPPRPNKIQEMRAEYAAARSRRFGA